MSNKHGFETIMNSLKSFIVPGNWPQTIFLLPEDGMADIYKLIVKNRLHSCVELGTGFGASSCLMAAAVKEIGGGRVVTIDKYLHQPVNVEVLKNYTGVQQSIEVVVDKLGYNWYLADLIARQTNDGICQPLFDFCLLDGAHEWEADALAFSLVAKLLKPGGWIVLDDINFTFRSGVPDWEKSFGHMTDRELDSYHLRMVYDIVIQQHPDFYDCQITHGGRLGWARKKPDINDGAVVERQTKFQLEKTQFALQQCRERIVAMETSKFWKLRTTWFKLKRTVGLATDNE